MRAPAPLRVIAIVVALAVLAAALLLSDPGGILLAIAYALPGLILALRRPRQPIAWLLLLTGLGLAFGTARVTGPVDALLAGKAPPLDELRAWANGTGWVWVFAGFLGISLLFPSGSLAPGPARRWSFALVAIDLILTTSLLFGRTVNATLAASGTGVDLPNPYAIGSIADLSPLAETGLVWTALFVVQLVALALLLDRFRRARGLERLQFRWLAWSVVVVAAGSAAWAVITQVLQVSVAPLAMAVVVLTYPAIPVAILIAVLRYRLYEIDRLVARTLAWGVATAIILAVFGVAVLSLQAILDHVTQGGPLAVAVSTLVAFVLFQPVRSRVQAIVDRRFDRPRVEAQQTLIRYGERLVHEVDLATIQRDVATTIRSTLRPASVSVWVRQVHGER